MKKPKSFIYSLTFNIVSVTAILLLFFSVVISRIGYVKFTESLTAEYNESAFRTAETAATLIQNPDDIDLYLEHCEEIINGADKPSDERSAEVNKYYQILGYIHILCDKQKNNVIYVFRVDTSDYKSLISVFNCTNKDVYPDEWGIGQIIDVDEVEGDAFFETYRDMYENNLTRGTVFRTENLLGAPPHVTSLIPLYKSDGTIAALLGVQLPMSELVAGRRNYMIIVAEFTVTIAALVVVAMTLFMRTKFVNPIKTINEEAARFAKENSAPDKSLSEKIGSKIHEISSLVAAVSDMEDETLKYIDNLSTAISEKQRMGTELRIASLIQQGSLPSVFPAFPDRKEFDLYASMEPAKEVGGDFYDFFLIDSDHLALVMADVSGKGVPAAVFMMATKILINERAHVGGTPAEILSVVNERISEHNSAEMFVTVWLGILEISTGKLTFANAGHDDPAISAGGGNFNIVTSKHGLVIGAMSGLKYKDSEIVLGKGDKIFLYTDGVPEATDKDNRLFTVARMIDALNSDKTASPEDVIKTVRGKVREFTGDAPQFDDITMLCFEYKGKNGKSIRLPATDENLAKATGFVRECLKNGNVSEKFIKQVELYVEEVFVNIAHYAYAPDIGDAEIFCDVSAGKITVTFTDEGKRYDPLEKPDPDITLSAEERDIGGLGIFMTKKLTDDIRYEYKDGKNILITEKNFE